MDNCLSIWSLLKQNLSIGIQSNNSNDAIYADTLTQYLSSSSSYQLINHIYVYFMREVVFASNVPLAVFACGIIGNLMFIIWTVFNIEERIFHSKLSNMGNFAGGGSKLAEKLKSIALFSKQNNLKNNSGADRRNEATTTTMNRFLNCNYGSIELYLIKISLTLLFMFDCIYLIGTIIFGSYINVAFNVKTNEIIVDYNNSNNKNESSVSNPYVINTNTNGEINHQNVIDVGSVLFKYLTNLSACMSNWLLVFLNAYYFIKSNSLKRRISVLCKLNARTKNSSDAKSLEDNLNANTTQADVEVEVVEKSASRAESAVKICSERRNDGGTSNKVNGDGVEMSEIAKEKSGKRANHKLTILILLISIIATCCLIHVQIFYFNDFYEIPSINISRSSDVGSDKISIAASNAFLLPPSSFKMNFNDEFDLKLINPISNAELFQCVSLNNDYVAIINLFYFEKRESLNTKTNINNNNQNYSIISANADKISILSQDTHNFISIFIRVIKKSTSSLLIFYNCSLYPWIYFTFSTYLPFIANLFLFFYEKIKRKKFFIEQKQKQQQQQQHQLHQQNSYFDFYYRDYEKLSKLCFSFKFFFCSHFDNIPFGVDVTQLSNEEFVSDDFIITNNSHTSHNSEDTSNNRKASRTYLSRKANNNNREFSRLKHELSLILLLKHLSVNKSLGILLLMLPFSIYSPIFAFLQEKSQQSLNAPELACNKAPLLLLILYYIMLLGYSMKFYIYIFSILIQFMCFSRKNICCTSNDFNILRLTLNKKHVNNDHFLISNNPDSKINTNKQEIEYKAMGQIIRCTKFDESSFVINVNPAKTNAEQARETQNVNATSITKLEPERPVLPKEHIQRAATTDAVERFLKAGRRNEPQVKWATTVKHIRNLEGVAASKENDGDVYMGKPIVVAEKKSEKPHDGITKIVDTETDDIINFIDENIHEENKNEPLEVSEKKCEESAELENNAKNPKIIFQAQISFKKASKVAKSVSESSKKESDYESDRNLKHEKNHKRLSKGSEKMVEAVIESLKNLTQENEPNLNHGNRNEASNTGRERFSVDCTSNENSNENDNENRRRNRRVKPLFQENYIELDPSKLVDKGFGDVYLGDDEPKPSETIVQPIPRKEGSIKKSRKFKKPLFQEAYIELDPNKVIDKDAGIYLGEETSVSTNVSKSDNSNSGSKKRTLFQENYIQIDTSKFKDTENPGEIYLGGDDSVAPSKDSGSKVDSTHSSNSKEHRKVLFQENYLPIDEEKFKGLENPGSIYLGGDSTETTSERKKTVSEKKLLQNTKKKTKKTLFQEQYIPINEDKFKGLENPGDIFMGEDSIEQIKEQTDTKKNYDRKGSKAGLRKQSKKALFQEQYIPINEDKFKGVENPGNIFMGESSLEYSNEKTEDSKSGSDKKQLQSTKKRSKKALFQEQYIEINEDKFKDQENPGNIFLGDDSLDEDNQNKRDSKNSSETKEKDKTLNNAKNKKSKKALFQEQYIDIDTNKFKDNENPAAIYMGDEEQTSKPRRNSSRKKTTFKDKVNETDLSRLKEYSKDSHKKKSV